MEMLENLEGSKGVDGFILTTSYQTIDTCVALMSVGFTGPIVQNIGVHVVRHV